MKHIAFALFSAAACLAGTALADAPLVQKAGEWQVTINNGKMAPMSEKVCVATDKTLGDDPTGQMNGCEKKEIKISGKTATIDTVCTRPNTNMKMTMHGVITMASDDAYHTEMHMHMDGAPQNVPADMTTMVDAKRLGPCQPGEKGM